MVFNDVNFYQYNIQIGLLFPTECSLMLNDITLLDEHIVIGKSSAKQVSQKRGSIPNITIYS